MAVGITGKGKCFQGLCQDGFREGVAFLPGDAKRHGAVQACFHHGVVSGAECHNELVSFWCFHDVVIW